MANESPQAVWFDDFQIEHDPELIVQENHYDPFGLNLVGIEKEGNHPYQYNEQSEKQKHPFLEGRYFYETPARMYNPALGRFGGVDAYSSDLAGFSPYNFALNNPINLNDPSGNFPIGLAGFLGNVGTQIAFKAFENAGIQVPGWFRTTASFAVQLGINYGHYNSFQPSGGFDGAFDHNKGIYHDGAGNSWSADLELMRRYGRGLLTINPFASALGASIPNNIIIKGANGSSIEIITDLLDITVDGSTLLGDLGGNYSLEGDDIIDAGLDIAGAIDPSPTIDLAATIWHGRNRRYGSALISGFGMMSYLGDVGKALKIPKHIKTIKKAISKIRNKFKGSKTKANAARTSTNVYKHSFKYADRVRMRGVQDPVSHNFPYS
ncbi:MAG: RHS repeat-associated core domain-containing protein, partial [Bacteroidota bacterium]